MARSRGIRETRFVRKGLPFAARAKIPKDRVWLPNVRAGRMSCRHMPSRDKQILPAIVVEVVKARPEARHSKTHRTHAARRSHLNEVALSRVLKYREGLLVQCNISDA